MTTRKGGKHLRSLHPSDKLQRDDQAQADCVTMEEVVMEDGNDTKLHFEAERSARHAERPGFRITELQISSSQKVPWHYHTNVQDTFFVLPWAPECLPPGAQGGDTPRPGCDLHGAAASFASCNKHRHGLCGVSRTPALEHRRIRLRSAHLSWVT
jgi:hypothetical protein